MYNVAVGNTDLIDDLDVAMPSVGNEDLDDIIATMERLSAEGKTPMLAAIDGELAGIVAVADTVKADSQQAIAALKSRGVNVVMLTGDNETTARAVAIKMVGQQRDRWSATGEQGGRNRETAGARLYGGDGGRRHQRCSGACPRECGIRHRYRYGCGDPIRRRDIDEWLADGFVHALDLTHATMRNIAQNLGFALGITASAFPLRRAYCTRSPA